MLRLEKLFGEIDKKKYIPTPVIVGNMMRQNCATVLDCSPCACLCSRLGHRLMPIDQSQGQWCRKRRIKIKKNERIDCIKPAPITTTKAGGKIQ